MTSTDNGLDFEDIRNVVNNSLTQGFWGRLPSGRKSDEDSCYRTILKTNSSLALLVPGWEGIPTNIVVNITLFVVSIQ